LRKAVKAEVLDKLESWDCPDCGMEWKPRDITPAGAERMLKHWEPRPVLLVLG
jgi:hypothetical protein